ncbi:hypothetical protein [Pseudoalteromonas sp. T1lg88]|uniref:hypothetical protein n=1 Tax=Pseudoalteromonas sp. T1lg88 TaxID=2077104 RepID=UPI000CF6F1A7|nr:hypothetical protein [Pseudoalteromonas sp. T1lg88]
MKFLYAKSVKVTANFSYIDWDDLVKYVISPPNMGALSPDDIKKKSPIIVGTDAPNKKQATISAHNNLTLLRLDIDDSEFDIGGVKAILAQLGITSYIIHTTVKHQYGNHGNRYRVYIQIAAGIPLRWWAPIQAYLGNIFRADDCSTRLYQGMYLPARYSGDCYEYAVGEGAPLTIEGSELLRDALLFEQEQKEQELNFSRSIAPKPAYVETLVGSQVSIIDLVNNSYSWDYVLTQHGYKRQGNAYLPPESSSGKAGAYILTSMTDGKERLYSHHSSDPCAIGQCIDQFDFLTIRAFGGDPKLALRELAKKFPDVNKHNKKEWAISQHNKRVSSSLKLGE